MADQQIKITLTADGSGVATGVGQATAALGKLGEGARASAAQTAAAMRSLPAQLTDVATQLQGGQSPLTILLQQGGQIKDQFGGVVPALRGVGSALGAALTNPVTLAAGAVGALVAAFLAGRSESAELQRALATTGNAAGVTAGQVEALNTRLAATGAVTKGQARDITQALVAGGQLSGAALESAATAAAQLSRVTGQSTEEVVKLFDGIGSNVLAFAEKANKSYHFLSAAIYEQIRALQAQGDTAGATRVTMDALTQAMQDRQAPALNGLGKVWRDLTNDVSKGWDALKGIGRDKTIDERIAEIKQQLSELDGKDQRAGGGLLGQFLLNRQAKARAELQASLAALQSSKDLAENVARSQAESTKAAEQAIEDNSAAHQAALARIEQAGAQRVLAQLGGRLDLARVLYDNAYAREQIDAQAHFEAMRAIDIARLAAQDTALQKQAAIESKRKTTNRDDELAKQAALAAIETQRLGLQQQRAVLTAKEFDSGPARGGVNLFAGSDAGPDLQRIRASLDALEQLRAQREDLAATSLTDAEQRGRALIAIEERNIRKRLDIEALGDDARREAEDELQAYIIARNAQLTNELKPEWQKMLAEWGDTTHLMSKAWDDGIVTALRDGEDAFVEFTRTGKINLRSLVDDVLAQMARVQYRKLAAEASTSIDWSAIVSLFGGSSGSGITNDSTGSLVSNGLGAGRADGGPVRAGTMYPVVERGDPELLTVGGRSYLMMGQQAGSVTPLGAGGASGPVHVTIQQSVGQFVTPGELARVAAATQQAAMAGLIDAQRRGRT